MNAKYFQQTHRDSLLYAISIYTYTILTHVLKQNSWYKNHSNLKDKAIGNTQA